MNRLRFLRNERGESLDKIASYLNVTIQTISNYETEKRDMTPDTILKLAEYFDVSTDYLLCKSDIRNPQKIDENKLNVAFESGYDGLNETNKNIINSTIAGLLAKQELEEKQENKSGK
jgi:transcriptional regulator with XRE-family HTH domain